MPDTVNDPEAVNDNESVSSPAGGKCPICGKPTELRWRPFCSRRCADVDLHRWFSGSYAIPTSDDDARDGEDDI